MQSENWIGQVLAEIEAAEAVFQEPHWLHGNFPLWVQTLSHALFKSLIPDVKLKPIEEWTAGEVGALLGHKYAYLQWLFEGEHYSPAAFGELFGQCFDDLPKSIDRGLVASGLRIWKRMWQTGLPRFEAALERSLALAARAPYHESVRFFKSYARAMQKAPTETGDLPRSTTATKIYFVMLIFWRWVQSLPSAAALHAYLSQFFGAQVMGGPKRTEKMCERLGLKFGQPFEAIPIPLDTDKAE